MGAVPEHPAEERSLPPTPSPAPHDGIDAASSERGQLHTGTAPAHLSVFVPGLPVPQGSMKGFVVAGRAKITHSKPAILNHWRAQVALAAYDVWGDHPLLDEALVVGLDFYVAKPASSPKRRLYPDRRPDIDKLTRAVLDALTGVVFTDDARIVSLAAHKAFAGARPTGVRIYVRPVEES